VQGLQHGIACRGNLLLQPFEQMGAPLGEVGNARCQPIGVQPQAQHVDRRLHQFRRRTGHEHRHQRVVRHQVPVAVDRQRGKRLVALQHQVDRAPRRSQRGVVERALPVHRRKARGHQQCVSLAQRHFEPLRKA